MYFSVYSEARARHNNVSVVKANYLETAGDHTSASSDSSIKFDVGVLSAGIMIRVRPQPE